METQTKIPSLTVSNPWWGHDPSDKQWLGLYGYEECPDLFYGGAAGPGKTSFLLMAGLDDTYRRTSRSANWSRSADGSVRKR